MQHCGIQLGLPPILGGVPGASGPLGRCALVYMDDCLVHSTTLEQHLVDSDVAEALKIFRRRQLYAKSSKCEFGRQELGFLCHRLSAEGVSVDQRKVQSIVEWATPTSCCEVRRFTGLANYYRRFVEGYAEVAAPLTALGSPTARFTWTAETQASFDALKLALSSALVLGTFDPARRAVLTTDASNIAIAAILAQLDDEGHQHSVAYEKAADDSGGAEVPGARPRAACGGPQPTRVPTLSAGRRGTSADKRAQGRQARHQEVEEGLQVGRAQQRALPPYRRHRAVGSTLTCGRTARRSRCSRRTNI